MPLIRDLPLFPLGLVLYPRERLPLHIFEPRYKEMTRYCIEQDAPFGVVLFDEGKMAGVGCTARINRVLKRYEDGRLDLLVEGEERFRVHEVSHDKVYLTTDAEIIDEPRQAPPQELTQRVITQHMKLLELAGRTVRPNLYQDVSRVSFVIAHNAGLTLQQKQEVLEMTHERERVAYLIGHFEGLIPRVEQMEDVRRRIKSNGHFKDFPPEGME